VGWGEKSLERRAKRAEDEGRGTDRREEKVENTFTHISGSFIISALSQKFIFFRWQHSGAVSPLSMKVQIQKPCISFQQSHRF